MRHSRRRRKKTMSTYRMDDGTVVKTENATAHWNEARDFNGNNHISRATGSQWDHETLYRSRRGRYWIEHTSQWQGKMDYATWIDSRAAAQWLLNNDEELPEDLAALEQEVSE
jgi:hypothetical protein